MKRLLLFVIFSSIICTKVWSQDVPPLERNVTIELRNEPVDAALTKISRAGGFNFSYSPSILNSNQTVTENFVNKSVREMLNSLFGESLVAKGRGNYVILTRAAAPSRKAVAQAQAVISGYVINPTDGTKLADVSIYNKRTLTGVITDQFGYFKITFDNPEEQETLNFSKRGFLDTSIYLIPGKTEFINMMMTPESEPVTVADANPVIDVVVEDTVTVATNEPRAERFPREEPRNKFNVRDFLQKNVFSKNIFSRKKGGVNMNNIKDPLYRDFQVSFVPFVGTNHKLSGNVVNGYSFNILGGYSMGTDKLEFGGLFNIDRRDVRFGQFAGLVNTVGGTTQGFQFAGLANTTRRRVDAFQFAGLFNANLDSVNGGQFAGLFNVNGRASQGTQFAGLFNIQPSNYTGAQVAGLLNFATHQMKGAQVAGLINFAHNIEGSQIGLLNFADSIRGVPIGLMSFVSRGYHKLEFSADEIFYVNASFRTGVQHFYNIITAGLKPESLDGSTSPGALNPNEQNIWSFGYGVGTAPRLAKWLDLNVDLTANHVNKGSFTNSVSLLNKLYLGLDFKIVKGLSITAGATLNSYLSDPTYTENPVLFTDFNPSIISEHNFTNGNNLKFWWGGKVGIRFF